MLNKALELEHAARIQYLAHAELVAGLNAEPIIERLKEIAGDEEKHEQKFRTLIGN
jgi:bacterioferritin (cytochrome b1)